MVLFDFQQVRSSVRRIFKLLPLQFSILKMSPTNRSERFYKRKHGEIEEISYDNYARWKGSVKFPLMAAVKA